jgi:hypothetical protein
MAAQADSSEAIASGVVLGLEKAIPMMGELPAMFLGGLTHFDT